MSRDATPSVSSAWLVSSDKGGMAAEDPFEQFKATRVFPSLDGLRAFSIIAVIGFHIAHSAVFVHGHLGVELFFAISGVLITTLLLREREAAGEISLRNFYVRRTLRIFPLYYVMLGVYILATALFERGTERGEMFFRSLPAYATYTSNWFVTLGMGTSTIFYFAWSLATEEQFYFFWPWIVRFSRRRFVPVGAMLAVMILSEVTRKAAQAGWVNPHALWVRVAGSFATPICLGSLAAYALHYRRSFSALYCIAGRAWSVPVAIVALVAAIELSPSSVVLGLAMAFLVVTTVIRRRHPLRWLLDNRLVRHVGAVSYGMYLMHMLTYHLVQKILPRQTGRWQTFLVTTVSVVVFATVSFTLFERRIQRLRRRFERPAPISGLGTG